MSLEALLVTKPLGVTSKIPPAKPGDIYLQNFKVQSYCFKVQKLHFKIEEQMINIKAIHQNIP